MTLPFKPTQTLAPLCVGVLILIAYFIPEKMSDFLIYKRELVSDGQAWRLLSSNFLHTNLNHVLLNLAGLTLLWAIHGYAYRWLTITALIVFCSFCVTLGLYFFSPDTTWYVGLSGALHGLFVWGAYQDIQHKIRSGWLLMLGVWLKIGYEQYFGAEQAIVDLIQANVAIDAHLYGAVGGLIAIVISKFVKNK